MIIDHDHNNDHNHDHDNYHDHNYFGEFYELEEGFSILSWFKLYYFTTQLGNYLIPISVVILFIQLTCYWKSESKGPGEPWRHFWFPSSSSSCILCLVMYFILEAINYSSSSSNLSSSSRSVAEAQLSSLLAACCLRVLRLKFAEYSNYNTGSRLLTPFSLSSVLSNVHFSMSSSCFFASTVLRLADSWNRFLIQPFWPSSYGVTLHPLPIFAPPPSSLHFDKIVG